MSVSVESIFQFLLCTTPQAWLDRALVQQDILLIDHANCEKKAAATALNLMFRYVDRPELLVKMSKLAREELRHFEQVLVFIQKREIAYTHLSAARYAEGLRRHVRSQEPHRLVDLMIIGAIIEARSCERFHSLAPLLDEELGAFYSGLLRSESRHYRDYLGLARLYSLEPIDQRVQQLLEIEAELIQGPDPEFRFHSGVPLPAN